MIIYIITYIYIYNHIYIYIYTCSPSENGCHPLGPLVHWMLDQGWGHIYPEFFGQVGLVSAMGGLAFPKENRHFLMGFCRFGGLLMAGGTPRSHPLMGFSMKSTIHFGVPPIFRETPYGLIML